MKTAIVTSQTGGLTSLISAAGVPQMEGRYAKHILVLWSDYYRYGNDWLYYIQ